MGSLHDVSSLPRERPARRAPRRKRGPLPETRAARRAVIAELGKARQLGIAILDNRRFPTLVALMATAEHYANRRPMDRVFHFRGSRYRWSETMSGQLMIHELDGRPIMGSGPGLLWPEPGAWDCEPFGR